jgi:hypothetical protein
MPQEFSSREINPGGKDPTKMRGGTKVGVGAWGVAVIRTVMEPGDEGEKREKEMLELVRQAEEEERLRESAAALETDEIRVTVTEVG